MDKITMLAKGNIRKTKGQMIILAILFLIASTLLIVGLSVLFGFSAHFDELAEELNASEAQFIVAKHLFTPEVEALFHEHSTEFDVHVGLQFGDFQTELTWNDDVANRGVVFYDLTHSRNLSQWKLVGDSLPLTPDSIYVPYILHFQASYNLGDDITITIDGYPLHFTVAGFVENIWMDNMGGLGSRVFIPSDRFNQIYDIFPDRYGAFIYANGISNIQDFAVLLLAETGIGDMAFNPDYFVGAVSLAEIANGRTGTANMVSVLMIVFTIIIAIVSILVIRFRIKNSIEEDMQNIGSLISVGYTSRQIIGSVVAQYGSVIFASVVIGILPSVLLLPAIGRVFGELSGMYWQPGFMPVPVVITVVLLTLFVLVFTRLSAGGIKKITTILALRGGVKTHSFKRNPLPLEKSFLPLNASLAFKSVLQGLRQSAMMFFILLAVSFTAIIALVIFYNAAVNIEAFEQLPGIERANAVIAFTPDQDNRMLQEEINAHGDVRDSQFSDVALLTVSGEFAQLMAMEDYSRRVTNNIFRGVWPRYANEVVLTALLAEQLDASIGDLVYMGDDELPFLVTGFADGMELGMFGAYITTGGMRAISPDFSYAGLNVYLNPGVDAAIFAQEMESRFADYVFITFDLDEAFALGVASFADVFSLVGIAILVVSAFIIMLVLYFVISSTIVRKHRDLGIQKAIGYTTANLMNQISLAFSFPIILGAVAGVVLGVLAVNPIMGMGLRPMGVMSANFIINMPWAVIGGGVIIVLAYVVSILVTWRIRKISAYKLITE